MWKGRYIWEQMLKEAQQHGSESAPLFQPIVEMSGDRRVLIENHHGVISYGSEEVVVKVKYGCISVCGRGLEMTQMTREQLVILGNIQSISLQRRERT